MTCWNIQADLSAYVDAELPAARRAEVETHLAACAGCRQHAAELRELADGVAALPRATMPVGVLAEVRRQLATPATPAGRGWSPSWGTAVAALIVAGMVAFWMQSRPPVTPVAPVPVATARRFDQGHRVQIDPVDKEVEEKKADVALPVVAGRTDGMADGKLLAMDKVGGKDALAVETPSASTMPFTAPAPAGLGAMGWTAVRPREIVTILSADAAQARKETELIAAALHGEVEAQPVMSPVFRVRLPAGNVEAFKGRLALREADGGRASGAVLAKKAREVQRAKSEVVAGSGAVDARGPSLTMAGPAPKAPAKEAGEGALPAGKPATMETQSWTVIEIRVESPGK